MPIISSPTPDATTLAKGKVQLANALAGTAAAPTINFTNAQHDHTNTANGGVLVTSSMPTGVTVQTVATNFSSVATGTTIIPFDDTIPQITEGTEFMTQTITPKSTTNILNIEVTWYGSANLATNIVIALFQDSTANALAADGQYQGTSTGPITLKMNYSMVAGTTSATTFRLRAGPDSAGAVTFNGQLSARLYGAASKSTMKITETKA